VVWDVPTHAQVAYWAGADLVRAVVVGGRVVAGGRSAGGRRGFRGA
jgi:imidazolonepropionase-like amidohydrolase